MAAADDYLTPLQPTSPAQKQALAAATVNFAFMEQTRILMSLQLASPVAWSLLIIVVLWASFLFCGFGVLSGTNHVTIAALGLGAFAATAMFLILDLSQPYSGVFRVPAGALVQTLEVIDTTTSPLRKSALARSAQFAAKARRLATRHRHQDGRCARRRFAHRLRGRRARN